MLMNTKIEGQGLYISFKLNTIYDKHFEMLV